MAHRSRTNRFHRSLSAAMWLCSCLSVSACASDSDPSTKKGSGGSAGLTGGTSTGDGGESPSGGGTSSGAGGASGGRGGTSSGAAGTSGLGGSSDSGGTTSGGVSAAPGTVFFDDFTGSSVDETNWYVLNRKSDAVNGERNACTPANVTVEDSILSITARQETVTSGDRDTNPPHDFIESMEFDYTSGHIMQKTAPFLYGTVEARLKPPPGNGVWPCFWLLGFEWQASQPYTANVAGHNWPVDGWCETDIAEFMVGGRDVVNCTVHYQTSGTVTLSELPYNSTTRFMVYRLEWQPGSMIWSVDAEDGNGFRQLRSLTGADDVPDDPQFVVLNLAVGGFGGGNDLSGPWPMTMQVDWIRVTQ